MFAFLLFPMLVLSILVLMLYYSWALTILWTWFMVPLGLPALGIPHAYGIGLMVGLFKEIRQSTNSKDPDEVLSYFVTWLVKPALALGVGAVVKFFFLS